VLEAIDGPQSITVKIAAHRERANSQASGTSIGLVAHDAAPPREEPVVTLLNPFPNPFN